MNFFISLLKKFVDNAQQSCTPQANFPAHNLNFHWKWRWWDRIQAMFLNLFYFNSHDTLGNKNFKKSLILNVILRQFRWTLYISRSQLIFRLELTAHSKNMYLLKYLPEKIIEVFTAFTLPTEYEKFSQLLVKQHGMTRSGFQLMSETWKQGWKSVNESVSHCNVYLFIFCEIKVFQKFCNFKLF